MEPSLAGWYVHQTEREAAVVQEAPGEGREEGGLYFGGCSSVHALHVCVSVMRSYKVLQHRRILNS